MKKDAGVGGKGGGDWLKRAGACLGAHAAADEDSQNLVAVTHFVESLIVTSVDSHFVKNKTKVW